MKAMANLLRQGRWADEIMQLPNTQTRERETPGWAATIPARA
jgi:hypothetical protein